MHNFVILLPTLVAMQPIHDDKNVLDFICGYEV